MQTILSPVKSVAVITPTTGDIHLSAAIESVKRQTHTNLTHYIIVDGEKFQHAVHDCLKDTPGGNYKKVILPSNTGSNGFNGHRIYAAFSYLLNEDLVMYLDEDNYYEPDHVSTLVDLINVKSLDWAYSLRRICDPEGNYLLNDNCESLGRWASYSQRINLVDTNCYAIRMSIINKIGHNWFFPLGADRVLYRSLKRITDHYDSTGLYTVNYRLHKDRFPSPQFFENGNRVMRKKYGDSLPWNQPGSYSINATLSRSIWSIDEALLNAIIERVKPDSTILEFGSGEGTSELCKYYQVISIEHDINYFVLRGQTHLCYYAPLENGWYRSSIVEKSLQKHLPDLLLVDGPPNKYRTNLLDHLSLFGDFSGDVIFDDVHRSEDYGLCQNFCRELNYTFEVYKGAEKHFAWCKKKFFQTDFEIIPDI